MSDNMPPPPPRTPAGSSNNGSPGESAPAITMEYSCKTTTQENETTDTVILKRSTNLPKRRLSSPREGLPPRPTPAAKRSRRIVPEMTDNDKKDNNENSDNDGGDDVNNDNDETGADELEYSGTLSDPDDNEDGKEQESKRQTAMAEIDSMMKMGLQVFQDRERLQQENTTLKDDNAAKTSEVARLRMALKQKQEIITSLFQAVETSKTEARQSSRSTVSEATLRVELAQAMDAKNQALAAAADNQRKAGRLEEQVSQLKAKLTRVTQEKFKLEREQRAAVSLARNLDQHAATDVEYYKRKVTELTGQIQSLNGLVLEKNRMVEDMQRQLERSLSRQAAAAKQRRSDGKSNR